MIEDITKWLPELPIPDWLAGICERNDLPDMSPSLATLLEDSLYFPYCAHDGTPVKLLGGQILSFVYVDCSEEIFNQVPNQLETSPRFPGFQGYELLGIHELSRAWWTQQLQLSEGVVPEHALWAVLRKLNPLPRRYQDDDWLRRAPACFSLLYICHEAAECFRLLYVDRSGTHAPPVLALIHPGNWGVVQTQLPVLRNVIFANPAARPLFLLHDDTIGTENQSVWPNLYEGQPIYRGQIPMRYPLPEPWNFRFRIWELTAHHQ